MRAYEFMINETHGRCPYLSPGHRKRLAAQQRKRDRSQKKRRPLIARMYALEDPIEAELRQMDLRKQRLELRQLEAEISQTEAETENEKIKSEVDGMTAVRSMTLSALQK